MQGSDRLVGRATSPFLLGGDFTGHFPSGRVAYPGCARTLGHDFAVKVKAELIRPDAGKEPPEIARAAGFTWQEFNRPEACLCALDGLEDARFGSSRRSLGKRLEPYQGYLHLNGLVTRA
jgi:hypothetical protein